jgi:phosphatidylglycerophosphate synthase
MPTNNDARRHRSIRASEERNYPAVLARLSGAQKSAKGAPPYSRLVNRRLGRYLAAAAYLAGLTPNQVTTLSALFSLFAIVGLGAGSAQGWLGVLIALGLILGYALDSADGQLARLRGGGSTSGEWLDHVIDATKISALHLAVLIVIYRRFPLDHDYYLLIPVGFTVVAAVMFFALILNEQLRRIHQTRTGLEHTDRAVGAPPSALRSLLVAPTDYGLLCVSFLLLGLQQVFLVIYALLFFANAAFLLLALRKWFGDMRELDPPLTS